MIILHRVTKEAMTLILHYIYRILPENFFAQTSFLARFLDHVQISYNRYEAATTHSKISFLQLSPRPASEV